MNIFERMTIEERIHFEKEWRKSALASLVRMASEVNCQSLSKQCQARYTQLLQETALLDDLINKTDTACSTVHRLEAEEKIKGGNS
jgi:hypothetical protein